MRYFDKKLLKEVVRKAEAEVKAENEEWVWVDGYKGTTKDMQGYGSYQFELGKRFDIPEGERISECQNGFHLCRTLKGVFRHYKIGNGNRFFKVSALVRASAATNVTDEKIVAKSVIFLKELDAEEIFESRINEKHWSRDDKVMALAIGIDAVKRFKLVDRLVNLGYSKPFAEFMIVAGKGEIAEAVGHQSDLSMDMKVAVIFMESHRLERAFLDKSFSFQTRSGRYPWGSGTESLARGR